VCLIDDFGLARSGIGLRTAAAAAVCASERRRRLGIGMVRVRSRGGTNPSAIHFRELSAGSTDLRLTLVHVAGFSFPPRRRIFYCFIVLYKINLLNEMLYATLYARILLESVEYDDSC